MKEYKIEIVVLLPDDADVGAVADRIVDSVASVASEFLGEASGSGLVPLEVSDVETDEVPTE